MEGLILVVLVAFLGGWFFGIAGLIRAGGARREAAALRAEVAGLRTELGSMAAALVAAGFRPPGPLWSPVAPPEAPAFDAPPAASAPAAPQGAPEDVPEPEPAEAAALPPWSRSAPARPQRNLEELITQRWGVWLGAGALLLAGVFLIRFAVEEGWLGPGARCALAGLLGIALIIGGEWLAKRSAATERASALPDYAPSALAAGGVAALFGATYAATALYGLLPPLVGFAGMAAAGALGMLLSLRRGPLVAVVGLVGAFVTPLLVETGGTSLPGLFAYLLVVVAAAMMVVRATAWGWLGWCATVAGALWVLLGTIMGEGLDQWAPALFVPAAAACFLFLLPREALSGTLGRRLTHLPPALLGAALLPLAIFETGIAPAAGLLLLSAVAILAGLRDPRLVRLPWIAAGLGLMLLLVWQVPAWTQTWEAVTIEGVTQAVIPGATVPAALTPYLTVAAILALMHLLAGLAFEGRALAWAGLGATVPVLALLAAYARVRGFATDPGWALAATVLAAVHVGAVARAMRAESLGRAGAHAAAATAALALGVAMVLRDQWLTLTVALFLPPLAMIALRTGLDALRRVAVAVATLVLGRLALNGFVLGYDWGETPVLNGLLLAYGVPAGCFWWAARIFLRQRDGIVVRLLECGSALFATLLVLLKIRHVFHPGALAEEAWAFAEAAWQCTALFACAAVALLLHRATGRVAMLWAARTAGVAGLIVGVILLATNPWATDRAVGAVPLLNALAPAYLLPALLAAWAVARAPEAQEPPGAAQLLAAYALVSAFAWVTLEVRRAFHPEHMGARWVGEAEMYAYSGAWLLLGAVMVAIGIRSGRKEIRLAALAVIALATFKVFLVDMDALVGLWRVLSFLGLGLALIALGAIYRRFVMTKPEPA
ncbi:DUF2339 domain-containing protein [Roseomonas terrae]|uniref:DUF2339 domain-containing protein n=1 Tax=Neoroseomonas terrae TaxID=424799 RepID=A0ABS5EAL2_9PROT|nr:DUF2339 domain-containing protein [Neoroseomonas terrae]MBR0648064.1 DUF2339 domain-containing protein [Neoroseomonas terrae]